MVTDAEELVYEVRFQIYPPSSIEEWEDDEDTDRKM